MADDNLNVADNGKEIVPTISTISNAIKNATLQEFKDKKAATSLGRRQVLLLSTIEDILIQSMLINKAGFIRISDMMNRSISSIPKAVEVISDGDDSKDKKKENKIEKDKIKIWSSMEKLSKGIKTGVVKVGEKIKNGFSILKEGLIGVKDKIVGLADKMGGVGFLLFSALTLFHLLGKELSEKIIRLTTIFSIKRVTKLLGTFSKGIMGIFGRAGKFIISLLSKGLSFLKGNRLVRAVGRVGGTVGRVSRSVGGVVGRGASIGIKVLSTLMKPIRIILRGLKSFTKFLPIVGSIIRIGGGIARALPIIGQIVAVVFGIIDGIRGFFKAGEVFEKKEGEAITIGERVAAVFGSILNGLTLGLLGDMKSWAQGVYNLIINPIGTIKEAISSIGEFFGNIGETVWTWSKNLISTIIGAIKSVFSKNEDGESVLSKGLKSIIDFPKKIIKALGEMITGLISGVTGLIKKLGTGAKAIAIKAVGKIGELLGLGSKEQETKTRTRRKPNVEIRDNVKEEAGIILSETMSQSERMKTFMDFLINDFSDVMAKKIQAVRKGESLTKIVTPEVSVS